MKQYLIQNDTNFAEIIEDINAEKPVTALICSDTFEQRASNEQTVLLIADIIDKTTISCLNVSNLDLGDDIEPITDALKTNTSLLTLILSYNNIGIKGLGFIAETLKINKTLESLDIAGNEIGFDGTKLITEALVINKELKALNLGANQIGVKEIRLILDSLKIHTILQDLNIAYNQIGIEELSLILNSLKKNTILQDLNIAYNQIELEGFRLITDFLKAGSKLLTLNFAGNQIGLEGAKLIADILKTDRVLQDLDITNTHTGLEGIRLIMESLKTNSAIYKLGINANLIGEDGGKYIIDCLKKNRAITSIECDNNWISEKTQDLIDHYTQNNKQGYIELGKFIIYNKQKILNGSCCTWDSLIVPDQEAEASTVIPSAIRSFLTLLPKINSIYLGEVMIKDKALIDNLKLLIAGDFFEISGICKKFDDDHPLTFFPKEVIALIAYGLPIEVHPKPAEDSVEAAGDLDDN